jgi:hypothetical protein
VPIVQLRGIEERKAEAARREVEAVNYSRQERDARDQAHELDQALAIVNTPRSVG